MVLLLKYCLPQMYKKQLLERANSLKKSVTKLIEHSGKIIFPVTFLTPGSILPLVRCTVFYKLYIFYVLITIEIF